MSDKDIIEATITDETTAKYILADFGEVLGVWSDGSVHVGQSVGMEIAKDERPIATIECPGWANQDQTVFTNPWKYDSENDMYIDEDGDSHDIKECVVLAIENDSSFRDEIIEKLITVIEGANKGDEIDE